MKAARRPAHAPLLLQPRPALSSLPRTPWLTAPQAVPRGVTWILEMLAETRIVRDDLLGWSRGVRHWVCPAPTDRPLLLPLLCIKPALSL